MARPLVLYRRPLLTGLLASVCGRASAQARRFRVAFANIDETPGTTLEGLGFTGIEVRRGFELAARTLPLDMLCFDNAGDPACAVAKYQVVTRANTVLINS